MLECERAEGEHQIGFFADFGNMAVCSTHENCDAAKA